MWINENLQNQIGSNLTKHCKSISFTASFFDIFCFKLYSHWQILDRETHERSEV